MSNQNPEELIKQPIKNIEYMGNITLITFENGETLELYGAPIEIKPSNRPICNFCNKSSFEDPLFTTNDKIYICKDCTSLAVKTFVQYNVDIALEIPGLGKQIQEFAKNIQQTDNKKAD